MKNVVLFLFLIALTFLTNNILAQETKILASNIEKQKSVKKVIPNNSDVVEVEFDDNEETKALKLNSPVSSIANASSGINYMVKKDGFVKLIIYDQAGNEVASLIKRYQNAGSYFANYSTMNLQRGIYSYQLSLNNFTYKPKLILVH